MTYDNTGQSRQSHQSHQGRLDRLGRRAQRRGLARIVTTPASAEYNVEQFLGEPPPTVPPVLKADLFTSTGAHGGPVIDPGHPSR